MRKYIYTIGVVLLLFGCSEEWMTDVTPTDKLDAGDAFKTVKDGRNAVNGIFSHMQDDDYYGSDYIVYGDLKGVDVKSVDASKRNNQMYLYTQTTEASPSNMWVIPYKVLVSVNNAIDNIDAVKLDSQSDSLKHAEVKANLYAIRALCHFDLLKVYARIPTAVEGDVAQQLGVVIADRVIEKDETPERADLKTCYNLVMADLDLASNLFPEGISTAGWFNANAITALKARVHLYAGYYDKAYDYAMELINSQDYALVSYGNYQDSWLNSSNNSEAILILINTEEDNTSREGLGYLWAKGGYNAMSITNSFVEELAVESADDRLHAIREDGDEFICLKYPEEFAYHVRLIRLSEMYFIAAEAAYKMDEANAIEAAQLINEVLKVRLDKEDVLSGADINIDRIILERRKEFVGEGHCLFDLQRNKKSITRTGDDHLVNAPMHLEYDDYRTIEPIPRIELNSNTEIQQNPRYAD